MKRERSTSAFFFLAAAFLSGLSALGGAEHACAICPPFACKDWWIQSVGQLNLVMIDRAEGTVCLVPNIRFIGESPSVALVVPTPALPTLGLADKAIWGEAASLTAAVRSGRNETLSCSGRDDAIPTTGVPSSEGSDDVVVHARETVGQFEATIVSSTNPDALVSWLNGNGFEILPDDAERFAPYVARGWFFTAMKMDTTDAANQMPAGGWDAQVNPVVFTYAASEFEIPLPVLTISMGAFLPIVVYVIDDARVEIDGFATDYVNHISASEHAAIAGRHPNLAAFLAPGRTFTRLQKTFSDPGAMSASVVTRRAASNEEFRRISRAGWGRDEAEEGHVPGGVFDLLLLGAPAVVLKIRARRARR